MNQTACLCAHCSFHLISCGFHHSLSTLGCCSPSTRTVSNQIPAVGVGRQREREENSAEAPPSALANDDALPGLEQNCVREIYTHNTPGAVELHRAPKHRHSITFYMIAGRAGNNGPATMSFCITDKCLIWLT